ncbi:24885_t:CDS:1, partial [Gigaspora rosea]
EKNKEKLVHNNPLGSSITPTSKIFKIKKNEVEDVSLWIKRKSKEGWATKISFKYLKNMIAPKKKTREKKETKIEHVTLAEN